jgi:hypothetical protein
VHDGCREEKDILPPRHAVDLKPPHKEKIYEKSPKQPSLSGSLFFSSSLSQSCRGLCTHNATLKQFPNIKKVVILTLDGHCFGDGSGKDFCLR